MTPLHWAAGWGNVETLRVLVDAGADTKALDALGLTAEQVAVRHRQTSAAEYLRMIDAA